MEELANLLADPKGTETKRRTKPNGNGQNDGEEIVGLSAEEKGGGGNDVEDKDLLSMSDEAREKRRAKINRVVMNRIDDNISKKRVNDASIQNIINNARGISEPSKKTSKLDEDSDGSTADESALKEIIARAADEVPLHDALWCSL